MKTTLATITLLLSLAFTTNAQEAVNVEQKAKAQLELVKQEIDLDENQEVLLYRQIYTQIDNNNRLDKMKGTDDDKAAMTQEQTKRYYASVKEILGDEQFEKYVELTEVNKSKK